MKTLVVNIVTAVSFWLIYPFFFEEPNYSTYFLNLAFYVFGLISLSSFVYIIDKEQKTSFFYSQKAKLKASKLENIFEYINSGFILFKNNSIKYMNPHLFKQVHNLIFSPESSLNINQGSINHSECNLF